MRTFLRVVACGVSQECSGKSPHNVSQSRDIKRPRERRSKSFLININLTTTGQRVVIGLFAIIGRDNGDLIVFAHVRQPCLDNSR